jgi:hypothetical protein
MKDPAVAISFVIALAAVALIFFLPGDNQHDKLGLAVGYSLLVLTFFFGAVVLAKMVTGSIDLKLLLGEAGGGASISRFQLLIFTFVIGLSFFFVVASTQKIPDVPPNVLALLGISATTYGVSKGIQASGGLQSKGNAAPAPPGPGPAPAPPAP